MRRETLFFANCLMEAISTVGGQMTSGTVADNSVKSELNRNNAGQTGMQAHGYKSFFFCRKL